MTNQIKETKEFNEFYQTYLDGRSPLSELYQKSEEIQQVAPSQAIDQAILAAAKKQANTIKHKQEQPHKSAHRGFSKPYSWAAGFAIFSLVGLLVFNTWEAEQKQLQQDFSESAPLSVPADYLPPTPAEPSSRKQKAVTYSPSLNDSDNSDKRDHEAISAQTAPLGNAKPRPVERRMAKEEISSDSLDMAKPPFTDDPVFKDDHAGEAEEELFSSPQTMMRGKNLKENTEGKIQTSKKYSATPFAQPSAIQSSTAQMSSPQDITTGADAETDAKTDAGSSFLRLEKKQAEKELRQQLPTSQLSTPQLSAPKWIEKIEQLLKEKQVSQALLEYKRFRESYPDFPIKPELLKQLQVEN